MTSTYTLFKPSQFYPQQAFMDNRTNSWPLYLAIGIKPTPLCYKYVLNPTFSTVFLYYPHQLLASVPGIR
jgi:hypothetical protein